jgi:L-asparaginase II
VPSGSARGGLACEPLVETTRGGVVECVHHGALVLVDRQGNIDWSIGDPRLVSFPRSSLKPFQLLALVARGGVQSFGLDDRDLAIGSASHSGQNIHIEAVCRLLAKIDAGVEALACGAHAPLDDKAAAQLETKPSAVHNNCSGKHAGMLALARLLGAPLQGYLDRDHPAQVTIRETLVDVLALDPENLPVGIDGCSAPAYAVPLDKLARGFALLGKPDGKWAEALQTISNAMRKHPELVAATRGRVDTDLMRTANGSVVAKGGAEGYFGMGHVDGLGLAFKILDGDAAHRARSATVVAAAQALRWIDQSALAEYGPRTPMRNWAGKVTGEVRPAEALNAGKDRAADRLDSTRLRQ